MAVDITCVKLKVNIRRLQLRECFSLRVASLWNKVPTYVTLLTLLQSTRLRTDWTSGVIHSCGNLRSASIHEVTSYKLFELCAPSEGYFHALIST